MPRKAGKGKRILAKKVTSFNLYADQASQVQVIVETTEAHSDAQVLRELLDEALAARRRKSAGLAAPEQPAPSQAMNDTLEAVQTLLLKLIRQGETAFRIHSVSLGLLQEILAESYAGRTETWDNLIAPNLAENGTTSEELARSFGEQTADAKEYAYGVAAEIKKNSESVRQDGNQERT